MKQANIHHRPQDDLPYERRMYYIIRDYLRMLDSIDRLKEHCKKLEETIESLKDDISLRKYKNQTMSEELVRQRRENKRLKFHIEILEEKIQKLTFDKPQGDIE